jgi:stage IV sporulation protein FB
MDELIQYPPKYVKEEKTQNVWLRSMLSLALYLVIGIYIFKRWEFLLLITAIVVFHELGHFVAMKFYRYNDLGIFFIPLLGAYVSGSKREVSQKESAVILLAGPLPGIVLGILFYLVDRDHPQYFLGISLYDVAILLIVLNLVNLLPVYPLDGGQLLQRVFLDEDGWISRIFMFISIAFLIWFALFGLHRPFYPLLIFPLLMILRFFGDSKLNSIEKKVEAGGIDLDKSYKDLPDEDYWKIRNILVAEHPSLKDIPPSPPFDYHEKEEKVQTTIESILHRKLLQDLPLAGKLLVAVLWVLAFLAPWWLDIYDNLLYRIGL